MAVKHEYIHIAQVTFCLVTLLSLYSCEKSPTLFELLPASKTHVDFSNDVIEDDTYNVLEYMNIYTGAGVAAGDINNDGLIDLYYSGNQKSGRLYINLGNLQFKDVTEEAGLISDRWCTGVSMVDINQDGFLDIYVSVSGSKKYGDLANLLYINNKNGTFQEKAKEFGLAEERLTMGASFFDYDRDGDLDVFLITNPADEMVSGVNSIRDRSVDGESEGTDILYRNNGDDTFTDVSREAGILLDGYSLGCAISDINLDGFPDIYVTNDFLSNDILYINNGDGTFSDSIKHYLKHTSFASMGCDVADFNNDGLPDIYTLDMLPEDNYRRKMIIPSASYDKFSLSLQKGYSPQYTRNCLQLNNGTHSFSDISFLSGVSSTDWSWAALFADYDNDGDKDLLVTNGFYRDLGDLDYITYQARLNNPMGHRDAKRAQKLDAIKSIRNVPLQNYLFENNNDLTFTKQSDKWGLTQKGFSNGACYADLDNDGDLELITNEFNSEAKIYENKANELNQNNFIQLELIGKKPNLQGIGAKVWLYTDDGNMQFQEFFPYRGYESSMPFLVHFGFNRTNSIDSLIIEWPDGNKQVEKNVISNQILEINYTNTKQVFASLEQKQPFQKIQKIDYTHEENTFSDFKLQPLLPHMHSQCGPFVATGDVNGDNLEDVFVGAALGSKATFFIQDKEGDFVANPLDEISISDDTGVCLFDYDGDEDLDLYVVGGGSEMPEGNEAYQDRLYQNNGKGRFKLLKNVLPDIRSSGSCVVSCDYDHDGDMDLFVGGRVSPGRYPMAPRSFLLQNNGGKFTDETPEFLQNIGMVTDAKWVDIDNDAWEDLVLVGEFMAFTIIKNENGIIHENTMSQVGNSEGWWNCLASSDFDGDGDIDFIAGNLGLNSRFKASPEEPLCVYAKDYDKNGLIDPVICHYVMGDNVIAHTRDEMIKQINPIRLRFKTYHDFASANFDKSFMREEIEDAYILKSTCFESSYFENLGDGEFQRHGLNIEAQFAPVQDILIQDFDKDGHLDVLIAGNNYASEASTGRYDAMVGLLMKGDDNGNFKILQSKDTGFTAENDVKSMASLILADGKKIILVANNSTKMDGYAWD